MLLNFQRWSNAGVRLGRSNLGGETTTRVIRDFVVSGPSKMRRRTWQLSHDKTESARLSKESCKSMQKHAKACHLTHRRSLAVAEDNRFLNFPALAPRFRQTTSSTYHDKLLPVGSSMRISRMCVYQFYSEGKYSLPALIGAVRRDCVRGVPDAPFPLLPFPVYSVPRIFSSFSVSRTTNVF